MKMRMGMRMKMKMRMKIKMSMALSNIYIEGIRTVFIFIIFFYERYFKCKKHRQKHFK